MTRRRFAHPAPARDRPRILPVFLPRAGCPGRCSFCAQEAQSGCGPRGLDQILEELRAKLSSMTGPPVEVAFYGGTFTALPREWMERLLTEAERFRQAGRVGAVRCSSRPDTAEPGLLARLKALGLDSLELGVQTFDDAVLGLAGRGHNAAQSMRACAAALGAGLGLTLHLLPGLPGHTVGGLREDIAACLEASPDAVRLHPCLVLEGTGLEALWRAGRYRPWPLEDTVEELAGAALDLWLGAIAVTRIGLAPEPSLEAAVLAGPRHPALGTMVRARALQRHIAGQLGNDKPARLTAPQALSGEFWGHARELEPGYARLGLAREAVVFANQDHFTLDVVHNDR